MGSNIRRRTSRGHSGRVARIPAGTRVHETHGVPVSPIPPGGANTPFLPPGVVIRVMIILQMLEHFLTF